MARMRYSGRKGGRTPRLRGERPLPAASNRPTDPTSRNDEARRYVLCTTRINRTGHGVMNEIYSDLMAPWAAEHTKPGAEEDSKALMQRISVPERIHTITADTYYRFRQAAQEQVVLDTFHGFFACLHHDQPWRIFWRIGVRHLCRQLTAEETYRTSDKLSKVIKDLMT